MTSGKVFLVGAGPGDPDLITVKALRAIGDADVVVYDRLVSKDLLAHAAADAEVVYAGKGSDGDAGSQVRINALIIGKALEGKKVVRLKSGDPFIFGRGGEEALALVEAGVPFEVVPGVSSASAAPACAMIPLTHRDFAASVIIVTGHEADGRANRRVDWRRTALAADTIVVLMGVGRISHIASELVKGGRGDDTPVALIENASTERQRTVVSTLRDVAEDAKAQGIRPPAVMVVGETVGLRGRLVAGGSK